MAQIRITKLFQFEMAHALYKYEGLCKNIHGHSYQLAVTIKGEPIKELNNPHDGMLMDFGKLKEIIKETIINEIDHALVLNKNDKKAVEIFKKQEMYKIVFVDYQPTCENMLVDFSKRIIPKLPKNTQLYSLKLRETASSFAEWYAEDN